MNNENKFLIYGLIDPITNEIRYIGKSEKGMGRPREHFCPYQLKIKNKKNSWIKSLKKINLIPIIKIIEICESKDLLNDREVYWISFYKQIGNNLTNMTDGGTGGNTGGSIKRRKPLFSMNLESNQIKKYDFIWQTEIDGFLPTKVVAVCKGKRISHKGHTFWYEDSEPNQIVNNRIAPVWVKIKSTGEELTFKSLREASSFLKIGESSIQHGLRCGETRKYIFKRL